MKEKFNIKGMSCAACVAHVERAAKTVEGVENVNVNLLSNTMTCDITDMSDSDKIIKAIEDAGYGASLIKGSASEKTSAKSSEKGEEAAELKQMIGRIVYSSVLLIILMYFSMGHNMLSLPLPFSLDADPSSVALIQLLLAVSVMIINKKFFISGIKGVLHGAPNMDTLVAIGSGAAFLYSVAMTFLINGSVASGNIAKASELLHGLYYESAAMILTLITVGKTLEVYSKGKTTNAIKSLMALNPETARVIRDGEEKIIPQSELKKGDIFIVHPGETIPADGFVLEGMSAVNESALTGESLPVDKGPEDTVSAATMNINGYIKCIADKVGEDTSLGKIIELVENASATKAPIARMADKVSAVFVPCVMGIALITFIIWLILGAQLGFALGRAISVLVISCPCALGLATPVAIMVGNGVGARKGILFKTAASMEAAGKADMVVLDKTGTVTVGLPDVTDIACVEGMNENDILIVAASLESKSSHPVAKAVTDYVNAKNITVSEASDFRDLSGKGISGKINGKEALAGNALLMKENGVDVSSLFDKASEYAKDGKTPIFIALDGVMLGVISVADTIRHDSAEAIGEINDLGLDTVMLSGDNRATANAICRRLDRNGTPLIKHCISDVLPDGKEKVISRLSSVGSVIMVGDGINDAPALTRADIGIAIGSGTDIAMESADIVLTRSSLKDVSAAIRLSRQILKNIKENLFWAFFYNCIGIPVAAGVLVPLGITVSPMLAAAAMSLSSFCVVTNALRLNAFDPYSSLRDKGMNKKQDEKQDKNIASLIISLEDEMKGENMTKTVFIEGMMCMHCAAHVTKALNGVEGVKETKVDLDRKNATVTLDKAVSDEALKAAVTEAGYTVTGIK